MNADHCPSRIAHESGVVLGCRDVPGHVGEHWTPVAHWADGDNRELLESVVADEAPRDAPALGVRDCIEHYGEAILPTTPVTIQADGLLRHAAGGVVKGPGDPGDDTIPAMLSGCGYLLPPEHRAARTPTDAEAAAVLALMQERLAVQRAKAGGQRELPSND